MILNSFLLLLNRTVLVLVHSSHTTNAYPPMPYIPIIIPYHIRSRNMKIMILIGIRFESYVNVLLYLYIIDWIIASILITRTNVKDLSPCRYVLVIVFDVVLTIVNRLLFITLLIIMDIQIVIVSQLYMMYVIICLFCVDCILSCLFTLWQIWSVVFLLG